MFDEPDDFDSAAGAPDDRPFDPAGRVREKAEELRMHAEMAAVFEGCRKFDAELLPGFDPQLARSVQQRLGKLDKSRPAETGVLPPAVVPDAADLLDAPARNGFTTNDYHIHRRPGEVTIARWLDVGQVQTFYERLQAHFDAGLEGLREDDRQALGWKQDPATASYLTQLDELDVDMAQRFRRREIVDDGKFVLSTQTADELNISYLCDHVINATIADVVGPASAPADGASERDLAWFYKLFLLRGAPEGIEKMCFFAFLQKTGDDFD